MTSRFLYAGSWDFSEAVKGIHVYDISSFASPSFLGVFGSQYPSQSILALCGDYLAAVSETVKNGTILCYRRLTDGSLKMTSELKVSSSKLTYVSAVKVPENGRKDALYYLFVSSFGDGTVKMIRLSPEGTLTMTDNYKLSGHSVTPRQNAAKVHSVMASPSGRYVAAANLGADEIDLFVPDFNRETLRLLLSIPIDFGKEPRHLAFSPNEEYLYCLTESGNRLYVFHLDAPLTSFTPQTAPSVPGTLCSNDLSSLVTVRELAVYNTLDPSGVQSGKACDVVASPNGKFIYTTNRDQNNIAVWKVLPGGLLDLVGFASSQGVTPRGLFINEDSDVLFVANNGDDTVAILPIDLSTGLPGQAVVILSVPKAGSIRVQ